MSIFSGSKEKKELMLVFQVGSSSVGGSLFIAGEDGVPKIIFSAKESIKLEEKVDVDRFLVSMAETLEIVAKRIYEAKLGAPSRIFCVLSSSWYISETRTISVRKDTPFIFSEKLADSLIQSEIKVFEEEYKIKYGEGSKGVRAIELKNVKNILNGYETWKPLNQKVKELEMIIFISLSSEQALKKIEDTIRKFFHFDQIKFSSFLMASFSVLRDMHIDQENFLLVDVGGEITEISMVKKNILRQAISFPMGHHFFTRGVAIRLGCSLSEANSLISLYKDGHAEEATSKKMGVIMGELRLEWLKKFQESLANISNDISIPGTIYMAIDKDLADFFAETIKIEQFSQYTLAESKFEVIFMGTKFLHGFAKFEESVVRDSFLIIDSIYINRFLTKI